MPDFRLSTPVVLLIFNRPETTIEVLKAIRQAAPERLFIIADGPRDDNFKDIQLCEAARALVNLVDWPCDVSTSFSERNLGCGIRPATGISWVFEQVEEAIILEDDCVPHPSFFRFCQEMLDKYRDEERVMHVSGCNFMLDRHQSHYSYYFSRYSLSGGWATWRRAWKNFDFEMSEWQKLRTTDWLQNFLGDRKAAWYWKRIFDYVDQGGKAHIWDFQWLFACWRRNSLCVTPMVNLIANIGYGAGATHTNLQTKFSRIPATQLKYPLCHPLSVEQDVEADQIRQNDICPSVPYIYAKGVVRRLLRRR